MLPLSWAWASQGRAASRAKARGLRVAGGVQRRDGAGVWEKSGVRYSGAGDAARATQGFGPCPALVQHRARPHPGSARRTHSGRIRFMSLALVQSRALLGLQAPCVTVEVHLANGLPSFTLVGLAEVEVKEARERVRSALQNAGLEFPHNKRITV